MPPAKPKTPKVDALAVRLNRAVKAKGIGNNISGVGLYVGALGLAASERYKSFLLGAGTAMLGAGAAARVFANIRIHRALKGCIAKPGRALLLAEKADDPYLKSLFGFLGKWNTFNDTEKDAVQSYFRMKGISQVQKNFLKRLLARHNVDLAVR